MSDGNLSSKQMCTCRETCERKGRPFPENWSWQCQLLPFMQPHPMARVAHEESVAVTSNQSFVVLRVCTAYESGFGRGLSGRDLAQPYVGGSAEAEAYNLGHAAGTARRADETKPRRIGSLEPDDDLVICPHCTSQFRAIPPNVQALLLSHGEDPPFTRRPSEKASVQRAGGACKHDFGPNPDPDGTRCLKGCGAISIRRSALNGTSG